MDGIKSKEINKFQHRITAVSTEDFKRSNSTTGYNNSVSKSSELFLLFLQTRSYRSQEALNTIPAIRIPPV